jgi:hypothetical protein
MYYTIPVFKKYDSILRPYIVKKPLRLYELILSYSDKKDFEDINKILGTVKSADEIDSIFKDKTNLKRIAVQDLVSQIRERKIIEYAQQKGISGDICEVETAILKIDSIAKHSYSPVSWAKTSLIGHIGKLEKEARDRKESCWRDLVDLRKELLEEAKGYRNATRLEGMIKSDSGYS